MSRVEKGSRFFRPVARGGGIGKPPAASTDPSRSNNSTTLAFTGPRSQAPDVESSTQSSSQASILNVLSQAPSTQLLASPEPVGTLPGGANVNDLPNTASTEAQPTSTASSNPTPKPLFYPEPPSLIPINLSEQPTSNAPLVERDCNESDDRQQRESSILSNSENTQIGQLSAAEKMKMKAKAAKAARLAERAKNPSSRRRSVSVASSIPASESERSTAPHDIVVPDVAPKDKNQSSVANLTPSRGSRISPQHSVPTSKRMATPKSLNSGTFRNGTPILSSDIPVSSQIETEPVNSETKATGTKRRARPSSKENSSIPTEVPDGISPRLKCKERQKLRQKQKSAARGTPETENGEALEQPVSKRRKAATASKSLQKKKTRKPKSTSKRGSGSAIEAANLETIPEGQEGNEEASESDSALDPSLMTMRDLCLPDRRKGKASEVLQQRTKLVLERRNRERGERFAARQEEKVRNTRPLARSADSRTGDPTETPGGNGSEGSGEDENADAPPATLTQTSNHPEAAEPVEVRSPRSNESDSDLDMEDLEEVVFDEFASSKKRSAKVTKEPDQNQDPDQIEAEAEEFEEQDYVPEATQYAPQLRVVNGQLVLDQESLEVNRQDPSNRLEEMEIVEESDATRLVNSHTWSKAIRGERWTPDETTLFYDAVRMFGSDFEMIAQLFPGRNRRQIRLKWIKEEKRSPALITDALLGKRTVTVGEVSPATPGLDPDETGSEMMSIQLSTFDDYAKMVGIDCSRPIPKDPMDKWREKEMMEYEESRNKEGLTASGQEGHNDEDVTCSDGESG